MPRRGTREEVAQKKQDKKLEAHALKYGMTENVQPKYKHCDFCGRMIMVNNYEDGKSRTPKWRKTQMIICPWCNPTSVVSGTVTNPTQYKTVMSRVIVEKLAEMNFCFKTHSHPFTDPQEECKCIGCGARKLMAIQEDRVGI